MLRRKQINSPGWKPGNQKVTWGKLSPEDVMGYITFLSEVSKERQSDFIYGTDCKGKDKRMKIAGILN